MSKIRIYNESTGEVAYDESSYPDNKSLFVKLYYGDIGRLANLTTTENQLLVLMARDMDYSNTVHTSVWMKKKWAEEIGCKESSIVNLLPRIISKGLLVQLSRGYYRISPIHYNKQKSDTQRGRLIIDYIMNEEATEIRKRYTVDMVPKHGKGE